MKNNHNLARTALTLLLALLTTAVAWADDTMTYALGQTTTDCRPVCAKYNYSLSQQIYTPAQLGDIPFGIKTIGFYNKVSTKVNRNVEIYMVESDKSAFTNTTDWVTVTAADMVFSGEVTFASSGWNTITLTKTFTYTATKNVVIVFNDKTGTTESTNYPQCRVNTGLSNYQSLYVMNNNAAYDAIDMTSVSGQGRFQSVNQLRIGTDSPTKPNYPAISKSSSTTATATWTGEGDSWNLQYKLKSASAWTTVSGLTEQSYTLTGLEPSQDYQVRLQKVVDGKLSFWSNTREFNASTLNKPTMQACKAFTANSVTLGWTENNSATTWQICLDGDAGNLIDIDSNPYTLTGLTAGVKHTAKVRAVSGENVSPWSTEMAVEATDKTIIGSGAAYEGETVPIHTGNKYSLTEEIYTKAELGSEAKMINSIGFYATQVTSSASRNVDVYMMQVSATSFTANGWLSVTAADRVFSGTVNFSPGGWINIPLNEPFEYDGVNNVAVIVDDNTGALKSLNFSIFNSNSNVALHKAGDNNINPIGLTTSTSGNRYSYKNVICLGMEDPVCRRPTGLTTNLVGPTQAVLDWYEMGDATEWQLCVNGDETNLVDVNAKPFTLTGLTAETAYSVKVRAVKGSEHGKWSTTLNFTTLETNPVPFDVAAYPQHTAATVTWTGFSESYNVRYKTGEDDWTTVSTNEATATLTNLTAATDYVCQVQGITGEATSEWSAVTEFTTVAASTKVFITAGNWNEAANWEPSGVPTSTDDVIIAAPAVIPAGIVATARNITIEGDEYGGGGSMARMVQQSHTPLRGGVKRSPAASTPSITIKDGGQLRHATDNLLVTVEKDITGYGESTTGGYLLLGLPLNDFLWAANVEGMTSGDYDLYHFINATVQGWENYKATNFTFYANNESAYLYANSANQTLAFTGRTDANNESGFTSGVYVDADKAVTPFTNGWRIFANNSICNAYVQYEDGDDNTLAANFYKMNTAGNGLSLYKNYVIVNPGEAIFVEVSASGHLRCSYEPLHDAPTAEAGTYWLPLLPQHGQTVDHVLLIDAANNSSAINALNGQTVNIVLANRTLYKDGNWNTLCLPFSIDDMDIADTPLAGAKLMSLANVNSNTGFDSSTGTLTLDFVDAGEIEAGVAYIVKWETTGDPIENPVFKGVTITTDTPADHKTTSQDEKVSFVGTYDQKTYTDEDKTVLFLGDGNTLYYPSGSNPTTIGAFRAYFQLNGITASESSSGVRAFNLNFGEDNETTGIMSIENGKWKIENEADAWYSLDGRKLSSKPTRKGLYIHNGNKVVIK